jgi:hypothetical protein
MVVAPCLRQAGRRYDHFENLISVLIPPENPSTEVGLAVEGLTGQHLVLYLVVEDSTTSISCAPSKIAQYLVRFFVIRPRRIPLNDFT